MSRLPHRRFGLADLWSARIARDALRHRRAGPAEHAERRYAALSCALRVDLDDMPDHSAVAILHACRVTVDSARSPFAAFLERSAAVAELEQRHGDRIDAAAHAFADAVAALAIDAIAMAFDVDADMSVTAGVLRRHGFDPDAPEPEGWPGR